eukprot:8765582-Ditylum_brightwellii.AAC.1
MKRLVWEAEYDALVEQEEEEEALTLQSGLLISDLVSPSVAEYTGDEVLCTQSNLSFVGTTGERKLVTNTRRNVTSIATTAAATTKTTLGETATAKSSSSATATASAKAIVKIKQVLGDRPKLLGAVLNMLIAQHGSLTTTDTTILQ